MFLTNLTYGPHYEMMRSNFIAFNNNTAVVRGVTGKTVSDTDYAVQEVVHDDFFCR